MSKTATTESVKDSDYYRRLGGYQGPAKLTAKEVGCPTCSAAGGEPCVSGKGVAMKSMHPSRASYAAELNERANGDSSTARWWRMEFRQGRIPKPPKPCGSFAAYKRHKRNGEPIDAKCEKAAREYWAVENAKRAATV